VILAETSNVCFTDPAIHLATAQSALATSQQQICVDKGMKKENLMSESWKNEPGVSRFLNNEMVVR